SVEFTRIRSNLWKHSLCDRDHAARRRIGPKSFVISALAIELLGQFLRNNSHDSVSKKYRICTSKPRAQSAGMSGIKQWSVTKIVRPSYSAARMDYRRVAGSLS